MMTLTEWEQEDQEALRAIYSTGQLWSWNEIQTGTTKLGRGVSEWIANCPPPRSHPILLPIHRVGDAEPSWLAVAFSETQCEELREHLIAFVGSAGSNFNGQRARLDPSNTLDASARQWAGGPRVFHFGPLDDSRTLLRAALERLRNVWRIRPQLHLASFRTTEAMLREFRQALLVNDEGSASDWLEQLRAGGRLNAENLLFLKIEKLAAFDRWQDIVLDPQWPMLIPMRRPRHTTALLIEALWRTEFQTMAVEGRASDALKRMREDILPTHRQLFRTRGSFNSKPLLLAFLLAAAADEPPRSQQAAVLLVDLPTDAPERPFAVALAASASEPKTPTDLIDALTLAQDCLARHDYDGAWSQVKIAPPSPQSRAIMLTCAGELLNGEIALLVNAAFSQCSDAERATLLISRSNRRTWEDIQTELLRPDLQISVDWETWLDAVKRDPSWSGALDAAHAGACGWSLDSYRRDPARTAALAKRLLDERTEEEGNVLRLAFPYIARFFTENSQAESVFRPIFLNLLLILALDLRFGREDWPVAEGLAFAVLEAGASATEYDELVQTLTSIWEQRGDISHLDWALDILDKLVSAPVLNDAARDRFFNAVRQTFHQQARRVNADHREFFGLLCEDLHRSTDFAALPVWTPPFLPDCDSPGPSFQDVLCNKIIGIYTLTEAAGLRAKQMLERIYKGIDVRLNNDKVGSDRLRALARESDYLVVASRSAKHAATEFIKAQRPDGKRELIYPSGKGSTSILSALRKAAEF